MTKDIERKIRKAQPRLRKARPLPFWIILIFAFFNIAIGISLYLSFDADRITASLLVVNELFTFKAWGIVFVGVGLVKLYSLITNNWILARHSLLLGVFIKSAWAIALTVRAFTSSGTLLMDLLWVTLALIQIATFIFLVPIDKGTKSNE
jgi:hypothetical protein